MQGISFDVKPGQVVALVGPSGGGKSTCVRLIEHFYELSSGTIYLGERDLRSLDPSWFRRHIGLVSQEPILFACSIRDNIAYGKDDATQAEVCVVLLLVKLQSITLDVCTDRRGSKASKCS